MWTFYLPYYKEKRNLFLKLEVIIYNFKFENMFNFLLSNKDKYFLISYFHFLIINYQCLIFVYIYVYIYIYIYIYI